jgi:hypothetical protein
MRRVLFLLCAALLLPHQAVAGLILDNHLFYFTNSLKAGNTDSYQQYHASISIGASIPKIYFLGWKSTYFSESQAGTAGTMTASGLEMGPRLGVFIGKARNFSFSTTYLPVNTASYTSAGGVSAKLSGTAFQFELCFAPEISKYLSPGFSLLYHLGSYSSSTDSGNTTSTVSYSRNGFRPSVYLHWKFGSD